MPFSLSPREPLERMDLMPFGRNQTIGWRPVPCSHPRCWPIGCPRFPSTMSLCYHHQKRPTCYPTRTNSHAKPHHQKCWVFEESKQWNRLLLHCSILSPGDPNFIEEIDGIQEKIQLWRVLICLTWEQEAITERFTPKEGAQATSRTQSEWASSLHFSIHLDSLGSNLQTLTKLSHPPLTKRRSVCWNK